MQPGEREQFEVLLAELFGALDKPLTDAKREGFWKGLAQMSLTEFARVRDALLGKLAAGEAPRTFGVADIWATRRQLRAPAPTYVHETRTQEPAENPWEVRANRLLLAHITKRLAADPRAYGPVRPCSPGERCYSDEQAAATAVLVSYKHAWAADMREAADEEGAVPVEVQRRAWSDCMERAEAQIATLGRQAA